MRNIDDGSGEPPCQRHGLVSTSRRPDTWERKNHALDGCYTGACRTGRARHAGSASTPGTSRTGRSSHSGLTGKSGISLRPWTAT